MKRVALSLAAVRNYLSFFLTLLCIVGVFGLAYFKGTDVTTVLPLLLGIYVGGRTTQKAVEIASASRDPNCDTIEAIKTINGMPKQSTPESSKKPDSPD